MSRKPPPFFTFFNLSSDVHNKFHIGLSQQHYPEDITDDDDQLSTKHIRRKRLEIMKMMVSEDITHDDDQLSTKTTQDHEDNGIVVVLLRASVSCRLAWEETCFRMRITLGVVLIRHLVIS